MTTPIYLNSEDGTRLDSVIARADIDVPLVAVYCGSRSGNEQGYTQQAYELGKRLADNGLGLVYGGASIGVMGAVADGVVSGQGVAVGVIPEFLLQKEVAHDTLSLLYITDTMHTRKAVMAGFASAFVVLAGGLGTLEEIMEIATWRQLYQHEKPMLIFNYNGFYDGLLAHLRHTVKEGFMSQTDLDRLVVCTSVDELMQNLQHIAQITNSK